MVYKICVVVDRVIDPYDNKSRTKIAMMCRKKPDLAVLLVNKQVNKEAKAVLFGGNKWRLLYDTDKPSPTINGRPDTRIDRELVGTFWNSHADLFRRVITALDFDDSVCSHHNSESYDSRPKVVVPMQQDATRNAPPPNHSKAKTVTERAKESDRYNKLLYELRPLWEWKRKILESMRLTVLVSSLDDHRCRYECNR